MDTPNFIDEMLQGIEAKEKQMELSHVDTVLMEINSIQNQIEKNFEQSHEEQQLISEWAIQRNSKLQERIEWLTRKLEVFMNEQEPNTKTIDLPHGQLLRRKQIDKIEVTDLEQFMQNTNLSQLTDTKPETIQPDKSKIKAFIKMTGKLPMGTTILEGKEKFSIKLKQNGELKNGTKED